MNRKHSLQPSRLTRYPIRQRWKPLCTLSRFRRSEKGGLDPPCKHGDRGEVYTDTPTDILPRGKCKLRSKFWWLADRAIRITYRISLRSSSLWEPRHSLLKVIGWHYVFIRRLMSTYNILHPLLLLACNTRRRIYMAQPQVVKQTEHPKILTTFGSLTGSRYTRSFACSLLQPQVPLSC